jgi:hypothetical protein
MQDGNIPAFHHHAFNGGGNGSAMGPEGDDAIHGRFFFARWCWKKNCSAQRLPDDRCGSAVDALPERSAGHRQILSGDTERVLAAQKAARAPISRGSIIRFGDFRRWHRR